MSDWNGFKGAAKRIDDIDIPRIGNRIGVGEDELHAFMDVEATGSGFDRQDRPKMLFEPHVFYRNLSGEKRSVAVGKGLAYAKWKPGAYPPDSYPRLIEAMRIDETVALRSASWGLGQILGENHAMVGYSTPQEMVRAFMEDEAAHLEAIVSFLTAAGIDDDLRAHRWETVARVYNGPQHAKHNYAGRMKNAYAKWAKIRDTTWSPDEPEVEIAAQPASPTPIAQPRKPDIAEPAMVRLVQQLLREKGFPEVGNVDGKLGDRTRDAITIFQRHAGQALTGAVTSELVEALAKAPPRQVSQERATATEKDLKNAKGVSIGRTLKTSGTLIAIFGALGGVVDGTASFEEVIVTADRVQALWSTLAGVSPWLLAASAGIAAAWLGREQIADQVRKYRAGNHV